MAESPGTWVKLGHKEWQYIPLSVREQAFKHDLAWNAAVEMTKCFRTGEPDDDAVMTLGKHMSNHAHPKSRTEAESSTEFVELTPRSAVTEKVTSATYQAEGWALLCLSETSPRGLRRRQCLEVGRRQGSDAAPSPGQLRGQGRDVVPSGQLRGQAAASAWQRHRGTARQLRCWRTASPSSGSISSGPHQSWCGPIPRQS